MLALLLVGLVPCAGYVTAWRLHNQVEVEQVENQRLVAQVENDARRAIEARATIYQLSSRIEHLTKGLEEFQALADVEIGQEILAAGGGEADTAFEDPEFFRGSSDELAGVMAEKADFWVHMLRERIQDQVVLLACTPSILPVKGLLTHGYSWRHDPFTGHRAFHRGLDISAARGTPIVASADGVVTAAGWNGTYGRSIDVNHGYGITTRYGHLYRVRVQSGDWVRKGEVIGEVGSSGRATGPHLHYEVLENGRPVDPVPRYVLDEPDLASRK
jgi:murein DD-endopeptidase MepM/ murein hydrolase activator NlpD